MRAHRLYHKGLDTPRRRAENAGAERSETMTRAEAIKWFKDIQSGQGVDRSDFPDDMKGNVAKQVWDDSDFTYGIEYGVLIALRKMFGITTDDLRDKKSAAPGTISITTAEACMNLAKVARGGINLGSEKFDSEKCYFHPERDAMRWRKTMIIGEPERVPLCYECCVESGLMGFSIYPLDERHKQLLNEV